tara:strand:- start:1054 stop:1536 length:483 start_codon:yes stop_codon:yes gene_type:complete
MLNEFLGDGPIAGSSFTEEVGTAKWQKPPKIVSPTEAFETFIEILGRGDNYDKVVFCMEEGLPIEGITNSIVNNMVAEGVITYDVALLMTPEVARVLEAIANKEEVEYVLELPRQINTKFVEAKIKKITGEEDSSEEPEEVEEEEEEVQEKTERKGLMGA